MPKYAEMIFFEDWPSTALNLGKCMLQLQSWQLTIMFHNLLRRGEHNFWQIIVYIDTFLLLRGRCPPPPTYATGVD